MCICDIHWRFVINRSRYIEPTRKTIVGELLSQLQDKIEYPVTHANNFPTNKQLETSNNRVSSMAQVEDAGIQTDFVDLQTREKELNRLIFLLQYVNFTVEYNLVLTLK
ncbi:hypothetical protein ACTXT7_002517 [Hymenolepis weldensis]